MMNTEQELVKTIIESKRYQIEPQTRCTICKKFTDKTIVETEHVVHILCHNCYYDDPDIIIRDRNQVENLPFQCYDIVHGVRETKQFLNKEKLQLETEKEREQESLDDSCQMEKNEN